MKTPILIRVDGGSQIGLGHIVRCTALAQMLQNDFEISFACKEIPYDSKREINALGFNVIDVSNEDDFLLTLKSGMIVVLDHYNLDSNYQKSIKEKGCKLVCIDDLHDKTFFADVIINHAPNIKCSDYNAQVYTQFALGLDYALLRPPFLEKAKETRNDKKAIQTIFVCFGGADVNDITQRTVNVLKNDARAKRILVVVGAAYPYLIRLKQSVNEDKRFFLYDSINAEMMSDLIDEAQLAIIPASGILQEVMAVGCQIVSGMYVENQKYFFENYRSLNAFEDANDFSEKNLTMAINKAYNNSQYSPEKLIDGYSKDRLLNLFHQLVKEEEVILKNISEQDLAKTFEWANNAEIRKFSFDNKAIDYDVHKRWFMSKLNDKNCFYYLGWLANEVFGAVRFDVNDKEAKISYLIDPAYQGKGLGTVLLKKGMNLFLKQSNKITSVVWGEVFNENVPSIKIFQKLGYIPESGFLTNFVKFKKVIKEDS